MSTIVYGDKSLSLAAGFRWSVLSALDKAGKSAKTHAAVRLAARSVGATRYAVDAFDGQKYLGLYTQGLSTSDMERGAQRRIYSLAMVFINAMHQSSDVDRALLYAILVTSPPNDHQGETRAVVIVEGGRIVHDGIETRVRAAEIVHEHRSRQMQFQLFCDLDEYEGVTLIDWHSLVGYADKSTLSSAVPRNPVQYLAMLAAVVGIGLYGAYHVMVVIPEREAKAGCDKKAPVSEINDRGSICTTLNSVAWIFAKKPTTLVGLALARDPKHLCPDLGTACRSMWSLYSMPA